MVFNVLRDVAQSALKYEYSAGKNTGAEVP